MPRPPSKVAIVASYAIGRLLGLPPRMATLVACGNSNCGSSAIAVVAPVIGADGKDVSAGDHDRIPPSVVRVILLFGQASEAKRVKDTFILAPIDRAYRGGRHRRALFDLNLFDGEFGIEFSDLR